MLHRPIRFLRHFEQWLRRPARWGQHRYSRRPPHFLLTRSPMTWRPLSRLISPCCSHSDVRLHHRARSRCRRLEQRGARRPSAGALAWRLQHENSRKIGRLRRHHRLRPDRRRSLRRASLRNPARYRARHSAPRRHLSTKATPARPTGTPRERAASLRSSRTRRTKTTSQPSSPAPSTRPAPASSRASDGSSASSGSRSDAKRPNETSDQSSASQPPFA